MFRHILLIARIPSYEVISVGGRTGKVSERRFRWDELAPILILALCFLGAALMGCFLALGAGEESMASLSAYLHDYLWMVGEGSGVFPSLWLVIWDLCRWPVVVLVLGFTALGAVAIPVVFCVRGFLLSYAVTAFLVVFGHRGMTAALALFGLSAFISVPVLFLLAGWAFPSSVRMAVGRQGDAHRGALPLKRLYPLLPGGILMAAAVFLQWSVMPQLLAAAADVLIIP